ncbi:hypothetical protein ABZ153_27915 [Streptomyces sp. NPDC006290]|uniref:hypothetical protein n=1 Tax=Streptomyces sp. NPDC006290 TaxID=3156745 RepID=UPI0033AAF11D
MLRIAVVGATGAVGRECPALLDGGIVPVERVVPVGSARSVGRDLGTELALSLPMSDLVTPDDLDPRGPESVVVATYQAAFGGGARGLRNWRRVPGTSWTTPACRAFSTF